MKSAVLVLFLFLISLHVYGEDYRVEDIGFVSHSDRLSGSIVFPKSGEVHSAVVFVHGSGKQERNMHWAQRFASAGVAAHFA